MRILDPETLEDCPTGEMGEVFMMPPTGPRHDLPLHRRRARGATADGWESVGDMGYVDDDGYLYLGDRRTDMILCGGAQRLPGRGRGRDRRAPAACARAR